MAPQVVVDFTASAIQEVAQAGIWAIARPEKATAANVATEYFILTIYLGLIKIKLRWTGSECRKRVMAGRMSVDGCLGWRKKGLEGGGMR